MDYKNTIIDFGTGDGRFAFKLAESNNDSMIYGVDPAPKQFEAYIKKANRKKLTNLKFLQGSIEHMPSELVGSANKIFINLPWGSLLESLVKGQNLEKLSSLLKPGIGEIEILLGYAHDFEPNETKRLDLPQLNEEILNIGLVKTFDLLGFKLQIMKQVEQSELKNYDSSWAKKLSFGNPRTLFKLVFTRV